MRPPVCSIAPTSPLATASLAVFPNNDTDPASGVGQAEQHVDRRRLARSVRPEERNRLAGSDRDVDALHGPDDRIARPERLDEATKLDTGRARIGRQQDHSIHCASHRQGYATAPTGSRRRAQWPLLE